MLDHTQALNEHANAKKAGYDNTLTAQIVTSFQLTLRDDNSSTSSGFILESILITVRYSLNTVIIQSECSPQAQLLIRGMLQNSAMFLEKLFQFMQRFYCELTVVHKTDEVESWHLVASIVKQVFLDLAKVWGPVRFVNVTITKDIDVASTFMWESLQAHRIMQEYTVSNFRGHPHVAPVVTLHLYAHRVPRGLHTALEGKFNAMVRDVKAIKVTSDKALQVTNGNSRGGSKAAPAEGSVSTRELEVLGVSVETSRSNPLRKRKLGIFELPHGVAGAIRGVVERDQGGNPSYFGVVTDQITASAMVVRRS
jgi:hypothetical protein